MEFTPPAPSIPQPDEGWSRSITRVKNAVIAPVDGSVWVDGAVVPEAMHYRWSGAYRGNRTPTPPESYSNIPGKHLWGGTIFFHFGHFLSESLTRLWAARDTGATSIIFTPKGLGGKRPTALVGYQQAILAGLGITLPVQILYEPAQVEELVIPGQGFGLGSLDRGTPEFREFVRKLDPGPTVDPVSDENKIYVSRTAMPKKAGSILGEPALEQMLTRQGFRIYHPQEHGIADQLRTFRDATHILGPDGSAFHLAAFVSQPHQKFAIIKRRTARECYTFLHQLEGMGADATVVDALAANWLKPGPKSKPDDRSWGEIDFAKLSIALKDLGYIDTDLEQPQSYDDELAQISLVNSGAMVRHEVVAAAS